MYNIKNLITDNIPIRNPSGKMRIAVPVDLSEQSRDVLNLAIDVARALNAELFIDHYASPPELTSHSMPDFTKTKYAYLGGQKFKYKGKFRDLLHFLKQFDLEGVHYRSGVKYVNFVTGLKTLIQEQAIDLVIWNKPRIRSWRHISQGIIAFQALKGISCPQLIMHTPVSKMDLRNIIFPHREMQKTRIGAQSMITPIIRKFEKYSTSLLQSTHGSNKIPEIKSFEEVKSMQTQKENIDLLVIKSNYLTRLIGLFSEGFFRVFTSNQHFSILAL